MTILDEDESLAYEIIKALEYQDYITPISGIPKIVALLKAARPKPMPAVGSTPVHHECAARFVPHAKLGRRVIDVQMAALFTVCQYCGGKLEGTEFSYIDSQDGCDGLNEIMRRGRSMTLHEQVLAFHKRFGQSVGEKPHVPDEKTVRFRLSLIAEEFFELLDAFGRRHDPEHQRHAREAIEGYIDGSVPVDVDLPALVDAMADLDYVVEGTRITFGVDGAPIAAEVQRANMAKLPSYVAEKDAMHQGAVKREDGKIMKPPGWTPPDIEGKLRAQGWREPPYVTITIGEPVDLSGPNSDWKKP